MGLFKKKSDIHKNGNSYEVVVEPEDTQFLSSAMMSFAKLLGENRIGCSVHARDDMATYRYMWTPYILIETTQLFNNAGCAMTYLQKDWRQNPFASGDLGTIDISISDSYAVCISASLPDGPIADISVCEDTKLQIQTRIANGKGLMSSIRCEEHYCDGSAILLYLMLDLEMTDSNAKSSDMMFNLIQLFALEVHRIFGSITIASATPASPPKSKLTYTPNAKTPNGGYMVYGLDGYPWWIVNKDFKIQSIVGEHVWREHLEAEADGLPLTATDYDNLHYYKDGNVYRSDGTLIGRYSAGHEKKR